jgi:endogenous inhibitor of DNA gyrase (YacG/DUF329 family)
MTTSNQAFLFLAGKTWIYMRPQHLFAENTLGFIFCKINNRTLAFKPRIKERIDMSEQQEFNLNDPAVMDLCEKLISPDGGGNWNRGNVLKYLAQAGWDDPDKELRDLHVAALYLKREIDRVESKTLAPRKDEGLYSSTSRVQHICPVCSDDLYHDEENPTIWYCRGRGHGRMRVRHGATAGVWLGPGEMKVAKNPIILCPGCATPMKKDNNFYGYYCEKGCPHTALQYPVSFGVAE